MKKNRNLWWLFLIGRIFDKFVCIFRTNYVTKHFHWVFLCFWIYFLSKFDTKMCTFVLNAPLEKESWEATECEMRLFRHSFSCTSTFANFFCVRNSVIISLYNKKNVFFVMKGQIMDFIFYISEFWYDGY